MLISEAFKKHKAGLKNVNWSVSAINERGELVVSLWEHLFLPLDKTDRSKTYKDKVSRWSGAGNREFRNNIDNAYHNNLVVRLVIAKTNKPDVVNHGGDASKLKNTFSVKEDWVGKVTAWDSDNFEIKFVQE